MKNTENVINTEELFDRLEEIRKEAELDIDSQSGGELVPLAGIMQWLDDMKANNYMRVKRVGLSSLTEWGYDAQGYYSHRDRRFFRFIGICVRSQGREVNSWCQPIMDNIGTGVIGLLAGRHNGKLHFLMQAKADVGNRSLIQIAPTVQFTPTNYQDNQKLRTPFLFREFTGGNRFELLWEGWQSEEGGRFFREQQLHVIMELRKGDTIVTSSEYIWMTPAQVRFFLHMGETVNACARSILSCLI